MKDSYLLTALVTNGNKADEKSVRLLFDGDTLMIDANKGEKIYKSSLKYLSELRVRPYDLSVG